MSRKDLSPCRPVPAHTAFGLAGIARLIVERKDGRSRRDVISLTKTCGPGGTIDSSPAFQRRLDRKERHAPRRDD